VAIGSAAGYSTQGIGAVAIGLLSGNLTQGTGSIAIGEQAGYTNQGTGAIAIGPFAGRTSQGADSIIIGRSLAGTNPAPAGTISIGARNVFNEFDGVICLGNDIFAANDNVFHLGSATSPLQESLAAGALAKYMFINYNGGSYKIPLYFGI
jgi:hypothetical protein